MAGGRLMSFLRKHRRRLMGAAAITALLGAGAVTLTYRHATADIGPLSLDAVARSSVIVTDRNGALLRPFTAPDGRWRLPVAAKDVDARYLDLLLAFEDRRFYDHSGVDFYAVARAGVQAATHGRLVSGGSTLTMQVARLLDRKHERTMGGKLRQIARARQLERAMSKTEILDLYLRLAPFGGNIEGVRAATLAYFGREPRRLSLGQAALLVALPQSPESRRLDRHPEAAKRARNRVLGRARELGVITTAEEERARAEPVTRARVAFPMLAPHLAELEASARPDVLVHRLTLDRTLQASLEQLAAERASQIGPEISAAIIVADHATGDILAHVGSAGYFANARDGAVDMARAVRSPGSTLKPFIYGLAFENGLAVPETLIDDRPMRFGSYAPKNFDEGYRGTVPMRDALAQSLNIPAVRILARIGPTRAASRFKRAGVALQFPDNTPTLAMALGGTGMTLIELAQLYATLPRGGDAVALTYRASERAGMLRRSTATSQKLSKAAGERQVMSDVAAFYVSDILKDAPPPANARGGRFAYKTGTSYGYRDALAVGYDGRHVIAVWVGRPDGASVPGMMGRTAAAPILFDAFERVAPQRTPLPARPTAAVVAASADLPEPLKRWREPGEAPQTSPFIERGVVISYPPDRSEVERADFGGDPMMLKAEGGTLPLTWMIDGHPLSADPHERSAQWQPESAGFVQLSVIDATGRTDRVTVRLK